ncbi:MAG TPA: hypothetical protein VMH24_08675, partial [Candidatus Sulfotelmatobacter sp.]|nr:hypothetical protein [Candidatus Sulfotelmatobacter sp.]
MDAPRNVDHLELSADGVGRLIDLTDGALDLQTVLRLPAGVAIETREASGLVLDELAPTDLLAVRLGPTPDGRLSALAALAGLPAGRRFVALIGGPLATALEQPLAAELAAAGCAVTDVTVLDRAAVGAVLTGVRVATGADALRAALESAAASRLALAAAQAD